MSHTPWSQEEAEKAGLHFANIMLPVDHNNALSRAEYRGWLAALEWATEFIAKSPTVMACNISGAWHERESDEFDDCYGLVGNLVNVRPIEKEKTDGK